MTSIEKAEQQKKELYYDPFPDCPEDGCEVCDKANCGQRQEPEDECDFNGEECIDSFLHHSCSCVGCEVIAPPSKEELEEQECAICQRKVPTDFEGYCQSCHDEIAARNVRDGSK